MPDLTPEELAAVKARHDDIPQDGLPCGPTCLFLACEDCGYRPKETE